MGTPDLAEGTKEILLEISRQRSQLKSERDKITIERDKLNSEIASNKNQDDGLRRIETRMRSLLGEDAEDPRLEPPKTGPVNQNPNRGPEILQTMQGADQQWWTVPEMARLRNEQDQNVRMTMQKLVNSGQLIKEKDDSGSGLPRVRFRLAD